MTSPLPDRPLPEGWRWARLGEVCMIVIGKTPRRDNSRAWGGSHAWAKISDLNDDVIMGTSESLSDEGAADCHGRLLRKGTLLYSFKLTIGKTAFAGMDLFTNEAVAGLTPKDEKEIYTPYLRYALGTVETIQHTGHAVKGKTLNKKTLALLPIPLPPPDEQRRIVARLDAQMAAAEQAKRAAERMGEAACALPNAMLREMLPTVGQTLPHGWRWAKLGEVCEFLDSRRIPVNGPERTRRKEGKAIESLYPYYGANGQVDWIDDYLFDEPAVLLAEDGGFFGSDSRHIAYMVEGKYWVNNHAHILRPSSRITVDFLYLSLRIRPDVGQMVTGSTRGKLNQTVASEIPIALPLLGEQRRIVARLDEEVAAAERARRAAEEQTEAAAALPIALLRDAFAAAL